jgi:thioredoxin
MQLWRTFLILVLTSSLAIGSCFKSNINNKMGTISITKEDFITKVADYATSPNQWKYLGDKPCIVDFYATWCGHCRTLMPILDQLAEEYQDKIYIYKVNVDKERPLSQAFKIKSLPTLFLCPMNGSPRIIQGALPKEQLKTLIDSLLITYD